MTNLIQNPHSCNEICRFSVQQRHCPWKKTPSSSCLRQPLLSLNCKKKSGSRSLLLLWPRPALCGLSSWWVSAFALVGDVAGVPNLSVPTGLPCRSLPELLPPHEQCHCCYMPQVGPGRMQWPERSGGQMEVAIEDFTQPSKFALTAEAMASRRTN